MKTPLFRIDDIGASTKRFNQYGKRWITITGKKVLPFPLADFWFFKLIPGIRGWAQYAELTEGQWDRIIAVFKEHGIVPIIAVTACWVERKGILTPFPEKFPEEAERLKDAFARGDVIIANHGLTHCIVGKHLPKFWGSNRRNHREFYPELEASVHRDHILRSQAILEGYFGKPIEILVPPGNLWSVKTYEALKGTAIKKVLCARYMADSTKPMDGVEFISDSDGVVAFHDRELQLYGVDWLREFIRNHT